MKIDWNKAPKWANYVAMDGDGFWYWHEYKPFTTSSGWNNNGMFKSIKTEYCDLWKDSLQKRPEGENGTDGD